MCRNRGEQREPRNCRHGSYFDPRKITGMLVKGLQIPSAYPPDLPHCSKKSVARFPLQRKLMLLELPEVMECYFILQDMGFQKAGNSVFHRNFSMMPSVHEVICAGTAEILQRSRKPKALKVQSISSLAAMQGWLYSRMETNPENIVMPLSESGIDLQLESSVCFSPPLLGKIGKTQTDKVAERMKPLLHEQRLQRTPHVSLQRR